MRRLFSVASAMAVGVLLGHGVTRLRAWIAAGKPAAPVNWRAAFRNGEREERL
jgi:hypothetical protein